MSSVSAHGGLVHVFLSVSSVSVVGISVLIENSPKLITFQNYSEICDKNGRTLVENELLQFELVLKQKYYHRKLFHAGGCRLFCIGYVHTSIAVLEQTYVSTLPWNLY